MATCIRCLNCQRNILASFISPSQVTTIRFLGFRSMPNLQRQGRNFHQTRALSDGKLSGPEWKAEGPVLTDSNSTDTTSRKENAPVPWYLQQRTAVMESNPFAERQRIPDIPPDSPEILPQLLSYISVDLGLDFLSVLDLRELEPPPALGANLIMIFGSVRSEKHLHVSADRLCRWLRSNYKLRPYADGLLGRNELKLKLKRKARRAKLLSSVSSMEAIDHDDGIRTGWICVNAGTAHSSRNEETLDDVPPDQHFVGFGSDTEGIQIVIQMMTDEKRDEMDLEGLWTTMLKQQARKDDQRPADQNSRVEGEDPVAFDNRRETFQSDSTAVSAARMAGSGRVTTIFVEDQIPSSAHDQNPSFSDRLASSRRTTLNTRLFHTLTGRNFHTHSQKLRELEYPDEANLDPTIIISDNFQPDQQESSISGSIQSYQNSQNDGLVGQLVTLRTHFVHFCRLPDSTALVLLGEGDWDTSSTPFLKTFYENLPIFPEAQHWECVLELMSRAILLGHRGYSKSVLSHKLWESQMSGVQISEKCYWSIIRALLLGYHTLNEQSTNLKEGGIHAFRLSLGLVFKVLEDMENLGYQVVTDQLFLLLQEAIENPKFSTPLLPPSMIREVAMTSKLRSTQTEVPSNITSDYTSKYHRKLGILISTLDFQPVLEDFFTRMLQGYANQGQWRFFWHFWNHIPKMQRRRTPQMYTLLFKTIAETENQKACQQALRHQIPEMNLETPPVELTGLLAQSIRSCLLASHAQLETEEWADLWEHCNKAASLELRHT